MNPCIVRTIIVLCIFAHASIPSAPVSALYDTVTARKVVNSLQISRFKATIKTLSDFGGRTAGTAGNTNARQWLIATLDSLGCKSAVQSSFNNVYCTKVGSQYPDSMYIVGGHYDGMAVATATDDNASGTALTVEAALAFVSPLIKTRYSIRFIIFNNEETGLEGSTAYVAERRSLQGRESPAGSRLYPEPVWKGMVMHDMILYDHGMPPQQNQIAGANIDIEYQANSLQAAKSQAFALEFSSGCLTYSTDYPSRTGSNMSNTDSDPFRNYTATISVRELQRLAEIGNGANPNWHKATDLYATYSDKDFLLGFNCVQMTVGTLCKLAGVYDSITTEVAPPSDWKQLLLSSRPERIALFDISGRKIAEYQVFSSAPDFIKSIGSRNNLPKGIYIVQTIRPGNTISHNFLKAF